MRLRIARLPGDIRDMPSRLRDASACAPRPPEPSLGIAIERVTDRYGFVTGGRDGLIKLWSEDFKLMHTYNVKGFTPEPFYLAVHTVRVNHIGSKLVVAMRSGEIYEVPLYNHSHLNCPPLCQSAIIPNTGLLKRPFYPARKKGGSSDTLEDVAEREPLTP